VKHDAVENERCHKTERNRPYLPDGNVVRSEALNSGLLGVGQQSGEPHQAGDCQDGAAVEEGKVDQNRHRKRQLKAER